jgi:hypothetical protein
MIIDLKDFCYKRAVTGEDGQKIQKIIKDSWDNEDKITINFNNILIASVSFFDEAFGKLAFKYPINMLQEKLVFENIDNYDRALLNGILTSRYRQKQSGQND